MCSPGVVVPGSQDPGCGGLHRLPGVEVLIVTCACTQCSWWLQQQPQCFMPASGVHTNSRRSHPSRARLGSALNSPLLVHPETMTSCLLGSSRLFPRLPTSQLWHTSPLQVVFTQPTPVLSLGSDLQSRSLSSQTPLTPVGEQTNVSVQ